MDIEKRLYEVLKKHKVHKIPSKRDVFKSTEKGVIRETKFGPIWMVETEYNEGYLHGRTELSKSFFNSAYE